jgi:outer membrane biosynthesis protein TonB
MSDDVQNEEPLAEDMEVAAEVTGPTDKASTPSWVPVAVIAVLAILLVCACLMAMGFGGLWIMDQSQPDAPVIIAPPAQEQPTQPPQEQPTQVPPEPEPPPEEPVEPPPEEPAEPPPEQPAEPPAEEQPPEEPPSAGQLPAGPESGGSSCLPLAGGLVLAPLLVMGKKAGIGRSSKK